MQSQPSFRRHTDSSRVWRTLLLVLLLVSGQLILAEHELHHMTGGKDQSSCDICLVGGGLDHAQLSTARIALRISQRRPYPRADLASPPHLFIPGYRAREPPSRSFPV